MQVFRFPDLGEGLHEAQVIEWHVAAGDEVAADDPLISVETDKAVTEVPAPWKGRISKLCAGVGDTLKVGDEVVLYEGDGPAGRILQSTSVAPAGKAAMPVTPMAAVGHRRARAMPAVHMLAEALDLDLAEIAGTGPDGMVMVRDIAAALRPRLATQAALGGSVSSQQAEAADAGWQTLVGPRYTMARKMELSRQQVAATTVHEEADVSGWSAGDDVTVRLVEAMLRGIATEPALNGWFDARLGRKLVPEVHLGIAVDTSDGLLVPVLRDAQARDDAGIRKELDRLITGARERTHSAQELSGATITLTNYGMIGGLHSTPVVVPPQVAILGAGRISDRLVPAKKGPRNARILPLSLTFDHRCVTGGEAARFIRAVITALQRKS